MKENDETVTERRKTFEKYEKVLEPKKALFCGLK